MPARLLRVFGTASVSNTNATPEQLAVLHELMSKDSKSVVNEKNKRRMSQENERVKTVSAMCQQEKKKLTF